MSSAFVFEVGATVLSVYNSLELLLMIVLRFKVWNSLYCKSLFVSTIGTLLFAIGFIILTQHITTNLFIPLAILTVGWYSMVTGFSTVMFSRLHLVCHNPNLIRMCKYMIVVNFFIFHLPTTVLTFGANIIGTETWKYSYYVYESLQITAFFCQETILGAIYLYHIKDAVALRSAQDIKRVIFHNVYIQTAVILMDIVMILIEYVNLYDYQIYLKVALYSIKLKLEFAILNLLTSVLENEPSTQIFESKYTVRKSYVPIESSSNLSPDLMLLE
ncbi:hypothetical protein HDV01_001859 [Terramyces sp. JEL0728]|nr:hypothetical protein HDV01_001859 [Terramyces sp. JEL0728]